MKNIVFLLLLLLLSFAKVVGQNNLPTVYDIKADTAVYDTLPDSCWQLLEEHSKQFTIEQVSQPPFSNSFHANSSGKDFDFSVYAYWFRFRLKNIMEHDIQLSIPGNTNYTDLYVINKNGKINHYITGRLVPWSKRDGLKLIEHINVDIKSGQELWFYSRRRGRLESIKPKTFKVVIGFEKEVIKQNYVDNQASYSQEIMYSLLLGIILLAGVFNLFFFWVVRERIYLFYALFLLFYGAAMFTNMVPDVLLKEHRILFAYFNWLCWASHFFFLLHFVRYFLETHQHFPRLDKALTVISIFQAVCFFSWVFFPVYSVVLFKILFDFGGGIVPTLIWIIILLSFLLSIHKSRLSGVKLAAVIPPLFFWCIISSTIYIFDFSSEYFNIPYPSIINLLNQWNSTIEFVCITALVLFFSRILFHRYEDLRKTIAQQALEREIERSQLIEQQKIDLEKTVTERTAELKQSLENLRSTQAQLIQSEKMASLGQLTAGIAHEIQNPLNFVNNFSEINTELIAELKEEVEKGDLEEVRAIANDIEENEQKIIHHGKRADNIVKGMLQHSRASTGKKELTNINALVDECVRLSYHGMRAKDKEFNEETKTELDKSIGKINVVPQDISRVLINLLNNAFYAVDEKKRQLNGMYEPAVSVCTRKLDGKVEIQVKDNGNGIPQSIIDKIFQPFFTTKPTGQGTGLGLSLSYDIVKAHGGEIRVVSKEGEGSVFIIVLPVEKD